MRYRGVSRRGAGYLIGSDVVAQFKDINGIDVIYRAHQLVMYASRTGKVVMG